MAPRVSPDRFTTTPKLFLQEFLTRVLYKEFHKRGSLQENLTSTFYKRTCGHLGLCAESSYGTHTHATFVFPRVLSSFPSDRACIFVFFGLMLRSAKYAHCSFCLALKQCDLKIKQHPKTRQNDKWLQARHEPLDLNATLAARHCHP